MSTSTKTNLILDIIIFFAFLVIMSPALTGLPIHEWLSLAFVVTIILHLLFHWSWLVAVTKHFFKKIFHQSRLNYVINAFFFLAMTAAMLSGILISRSILDFLGIRLNNISREWESIHRLTANWSLMLLGVHFALHFKWVLTHLDRYLLKPFAGIFRRKELAAQPIRAEKN
jgi:hypothetical protein